MTSDSFADRVDRAIDAFPSYTGEERFEAEGALFVRNRSIPDRYYANRVEQVTASTPEEIARLNERVEVEFRGFRHRCFYVDRDTPTEFEAWLLMEGYHRSDSLVMVLTDELRRHTEASQDSPRRDRRRLAGLPRSVGCGGPGVRPRHSASDRQRPSSGKARPSHRRPAVDLSTRPVLDGVR